MLNMDNLLLFFGLGIVVFLIILACYYIDEQKDKKERMQLTQVLNEMISSHKQCNESLQQLLELMQKQVSQPKIELEMPKNYDINKLFEDE